jgi:uncharacterized membrane protein
VEAFSDGVLAIIITIMVLELKAPEHGDGWAALRGLAPVFLAYVLSFVYVGIYWNNHHHLFQAAGRVNGSVLWANLHLLFWLSLLPAATAWMGHEPSATVPSVVYGMVLVLAAVAYRVLEQRMIAADPDGMLGRALGQRWKEWASILLYLMGVGLSVVQPAVGQGLYLLVAGLWLVPDRRIERAMPVSRR